MEKCIPKINDVWEMREIADDFTDPLEVFREAISNAYDAKATEIRISVYKAKENEYKYSPLIIKISDNGTGMTREQIDNFWSLGYSEKRNKNQDQIGCKGHGTMIYMKSKYIQVQTTNQNNAYKTFCSDPMQSLMEGKMYEPCIEEIQKSPDGTGTEIILEGYIDNETTFSKNTLRFEDVKDYILWFTKHGSIEKEFDIKKRQKSRLILNIFDQEETLDYGHIFPKENCNIKQLKEEFPDEDIEEHFVKKYQKSIKLEAFPSYKCDIVLYYEGKEARKEVNPCIRNKNYTESSRYGLYLCKDYIPIERVNHWIKTFAGGSNGFLRLHGFVNCQDFYLTANRGSVSLKNKDVMEEISKETDKCIKEFVNELEKSGLFKYVDQMKAIKTLEDENDFYYHRIQKSEKKEFSKIIGSENNIEIYVPENENEVFYVYTILSTIHPEAFSFKPVDYSTAKGIDMLVKTGDQKYGREYAYVEVKKTLSKKPFNHSFSNIAYVLCWEISANAQNGDEFESSIDGCDKKWILKREKNGAYLMPKDGGRINIEIIELKKIYDKYVEKD